MANTITIDSRDLDYTIDSYQTFSLNDHEVTEWDDDKNDEKMLEYGEDYEYDAKAYIQSLAERSVEVLKDNLIFKGSIIKDIKLIKVESPQFYNYTTDHYTAEYTYDKDALQAFAKTIIGSDWLNYIRDNWQGSYYKLNEGGDDFDAESLELAHLDYYMRSIYSYDQYVTDMFECLYELQNEAVVYLDQTITLAGLGEFEEEDDIKELEKLAKDNNCEFYPTYYDHELKGKQKDVAAVTMAKWSMPKDEWSENGFTETVV